MQGLFDYYNELTENKSVKSFFILWGINVILMLFAFVCIALSVIGLLWLISWLLTLVHGALIVVIICIIFMGLGFTRMQRDDSY